MDISIGIDLLGLGAGGFIIIFFYIFYTML